MDPDEEAIAIFRTSIGPYMSQRNFCSLMGINRGNFSSYLSGKRGSPASRNAILQYYNKYVLNKANDSTPQDNFSEVQDLKRTIVYPCKYFLRNDCNQGSDHPCQDYHPVSQELHQEHYLLQAKLFRDEVINRITELKTTPQIILFIDGDQEIPTILNFIEEMEKNAEYMHARFFGIVFFSPKSIDVYRRYIFSQSSQLFGFIPSISTTTDAVDVKIAMEVMQLHILLPKERNIQFGIYSLNWYCVEIAENLKVLQRTVFTLKMLSIQIIKEKLSLETTSTPQMQANSKYSFDLLEPFLKKIDNAIIKQGGTLKFIKVNDIVPWSELIKVCANKNWHSVLIEPKNLEYLQCDFINTADGGYLIKKDYKHTEVPVSKKVELLSQFKPWIEELHQIIQLNPVEYRSKLVTVLFSHLEHPEAISMSSGINLSNQFVQGFLKLSATIEFVQQFCKIFQISDSVCIEKISLILCMLFGPIELNNFLQKESSLHVLEFLKSSEKEEADAFRKDLKSNILFSFLSKKSHEFEPTPIAKTPQVNQKQTADAKIDELIEAVKKMSYINELKQFARENKIASVPLNVGGIFARTKEDIKNELIAFLNTMKHAK